MEKALLAMFLILFVGRFFFRYILQQKNIAHLKKYGKKIPAVFTGSTEQGTLNKIVDYTIDNSRLEARQNLADDIITLAVLFLFLPFFIGWLAGSNMNFIIQALVFFGFFALLASIVGIPFDLYDNFVLEKKYGFSTITWPLWITDLIKSATICVVLLSIIVSALMAFVLYFPQSWWFWGWVFFTLFQLVMMWLFPVLIAPLFNKYEAIKDDELQGKITALMEKAGLKTKGIFQVDEGKRSKHTNAYFTGIGKTKRIVLYDTLLESHTHDEILAVLAHEIGHWKRKHITKQMTFMIIGSLVLLYVVYLAVNWQTLYAAFGLKQMPVYAGLFLASLYLGTAGFFLNPIGAALSRRYEREADFMAWKLTGKTTPMIDALRRLAKDNLANLHPHPFYVWFYYSHPPLVQRIEYLNSLDTPKITKRESP